MASRTPTAVAAPTLSIDSFPSWASLRELAAYHSPEPTALSLFVNLDPREAATRPAFATHLHAVLDEARKKVAAATHGQEHAVKVILQGALKRAGDYFQALDREDSLVLIRALAVFSGGDGLFRTFHLTEPTATKASVGRAFHLAPLVSSLVESDEALIVQVGREQGHIRLLRHGRLHELNDLSEWIHGQHDQGGWSQARYQRSIEKDFHDHLRLVAHALEELTRRERRPLVFVGPEESHGEMTRELEHEAPEACRLVAGWVHAKTTANPPELVAAVEPSLEEWWRSKERALLDNWREATAKETHGLGGWAEVLAAAADGRVEVLLYANPTERMKEPVPKAFECPQCGRAQIAGGECPLDGTILLVNDNALDVATRLTLSFGGQVLACRYHDDLAPYEGIGALLRY